MVHRHRSPLAIEAVLIGMAGVRLQLKQIGLIGAQGGDAPGHLLREADENDRTPRHADAARLYFANRAAKGFTAIQSVIVRSPEGGSMAHAYGFEPFENGDWSQPRLRPGANDDYWDHIDWSLAEAKRQGLRMAALPCWLDAVTDDNPMVRDPGVAYRYGHFLGTRYGQEPHLIWVLGGDAWQKERNVDTPSRLALVRAMAEGIADGDGGVDLSKSPGTLTVEWIDAGQGSSTPAGEVEGGAVRSFKAPFGGDAVLYLCGRR